MKSNQISIKEIAKLCDVSVATVSRVINNNGRFSEETRKKVLDVIEKYQYSTNTVAKTLRMNKSKTIGIIVPDISNEFFLQLCMKLKVISLTEDSLLLFVTQIKAKKKKWLISHL